MRTSKILTLATIVILGAGFAGAPEAQARDWPNPFRWMKNKMKGEKPAPPPPPSVPPRPMNPPPTTPPAPPTAPARNDPPAPHGAPKDAPHNGPPGGPSPKLVKNDAPPASGDPKPSQGGPTGGAEPGTPVHTHVFRTAREEVVEPARYERVPAGRDKHGAPRFENRLVAPERRVLKDVQKCACGAIK